MNQEGFVYILKSKKNDRFYIGSTNNLERRLAEHKNGQSKATKCLLPIKLCFYQNYETLNEARRVEHKIKKFKSRKLIEKIIQEKCINFKGD